MACRSPSCPRTPTDRGLGIGEAVRRIVAIDTCHRALGAEAAIEEKPLSERRGGRVVGDGVGRRCHELRGGELHAAEVRRIDVTATRESCVIASVATRASCKSPWDIFAARSAVLRLFRDICGVVERALPITRRRYGGLRVVSAVGISSEVTPRGRLGRRRSRPARSSAIASRYSASSTRASRG